MTQMAVQLPNQLMLLASLKHDQDAALKENAAMEGRYATAPMHENQLRKQFQVHTCIMHATYTDCVYLLAMHAQYARAQGLPLPAGPIRLLEQDMDVAD